MLTGIDSSDPDTTIGEDCPGGVDLNRNYGYQWDYPGGSSNITSSETYRGEEPFSEPETLALANFVRENNFTSAVSLHSGSSMVLAPWAYNVSVACPDKEQYDLVGDKLCGLDTKIDFDTIHTSIKRFKRISQISAKPEEVEIPLRNIQQIEYRKISAGNTILFVMVSIICIGVIIAAATIKIPDFSNLGDDFEETGRGW